MGIVVFSAKTEYALLALLELAAIHAQEGVLQVGEIAQRQGIPDRYLEQMLSTLRRARLLRSVRGPRGGYRLERPPSEIRLIEVINALDGESPSRGGRSGDTPEAMVLSALEKKLNGVRQEILDSTSLKDLLEQRNILVQEQTMYFI